MLRRLACSCAPSGISPPGRDVTEPVREDGPVHAFRRTRDGYQTRLDADERAIIARVVSDVAQLLGVDVSQPPVDADAAGQGLPTLTWPTVGLGEESPEDAFGADALREPLDPALARLLPSASEDDAVAREVRALTEESVRTAKGERLRSVWWALQAPGHKVSIPVDRAMDWAGALTDIRLVLAQRLGVEDAEDAADLEAVATSGTDEVSRALASLYLALSWLQESLVEAMLSDLPE